MSSSSIINEDVGDDDYVDAQTESQFVSLLREDETDEKEVATYVQKLCKMCSDHSEALVDHIAQFEESGKDFSRERQLATTEWITFYHLLNKEVDKADRSTVSDLLFENICCMQLYSRPKNERPAAGSVKPGTLLLVARCAASQHTPELSSFWPTKEFLEQLMDYSAEIVVNKLIQPIIGQPLTLSNDEWDLQPNGLTAWVPPAILYQLQLVDTDEDMDKARREEEEEATESTIEQQPVSDSTEAKIGMTLRSSSSSSSNSEESTVPVVDASRPTIMRVHRFSTPPVMQDGSFIRDRELGNFWNESVRPEAVFVQQMSRIFHGFMFETRILERWDCIEAASSEKFAPQVPLPTLKSQFQAWLHEFCTIESRDDFESNFRAALHEHYLPINSRLFAKSRTRGSAESAQHTSSQLLKFELGVDAGSNVKRLFGKRLREIGQQPNHPYYDLFVAHMFAYCLLQEQRIDFQESFLLSGYKIYEREPSLSLTKKWGRIREPLLVWIARKWHIQWIDPETLQPHWLRCQDSVEACLFWLLVLQKNHDSTLCDGHTLGDWSEQFLQLPPPPDNYD